MMMPGAPYEQTQNQIPSLIATHQSRSRPYLPPGPRITPVIRLISAAMNIGQIVTDSTDCKVYARTTAESVRIAVKTSTAPHGLKTASRKAIVRAVGARQSGEAPTSSYPACGRFACSPSGLQATSSST